MQVVRRLFTVAAALSATTLPALAADQAWPNRAIRVIVPFTVGSSADIIGRTFTDQLSVALGQPVVVENRGGAGGTIGVELGAKLGRRPGSLKRRFELVEGGDECLGDETSPELTEAPI